jgi:hypothetical protein
VLILGGGGDAPLNGKMAQESGDFFFAHLSRMPFLVEEDVAPDPIQVGLLGADAVTFDPQMPADAVEQLRAGRGAGRWRGKL